MDLPLNNSTALWDNVYSGWMESPQVRSTTDILWTCLATICLCVYTAVHLNIPEPGEPKHWQSIRRAKWVIIAILAPEIVLQIAWRQFLRARYLQRKLKEHIRRHHDSNVQVLELQTVSTGSTVSEQSRSTTDTVSKGTSNVTELFEIPEEDDITLIYAFHAEMGGCRVRIRDKSYSLTVAGILTAAEHGVFWNISTASIEDKSKADNLAKSLTVLQVMWMLLQCCARKYAGLPLALLELHTFIHAICAAFMFVLWFKKPLNVRDAMVITLPPQFNQLITILLRNDNDRDALLVSVCQPNFGSPRITKLSFREKYSLSHAFLTPILGQYKTMPLEDGGGIALLVDGIGLFLVQLVYGCLHMIAWNSFFPTVLEKWFWRSSCIAVAGGFGMVMLTFGVLVPMLEKYHDIAEWIFYTMNVVYVSMWTAGRMFIVVESGLALRSVPIGVYAVVSWSNYLPHI